MTDYTEILFLVGRILVGVFFLMMAFGHFTNKKSMTDYAKMKGVPLAGLSVLGTGVLLLLGGLSFLLGLYPQIGVLAVSIFFIGVTPKMHDFWNIEDAMQRQGEMTNFFKNIAILGSSLMFLLISDWPLSLSI